MDMNIASADDCAREKEILENLIEEARELLSEEQKEQFKIANAAWNKFLEASVEMEGLEYEGGSMQPIIENLARTGLTKQRQVQIRGLIKYTREV